MTMRLVKAIMATMMNVVLCARSILPFYASTGFSPLRLLAALSLTALSLSLTLYPTASYAVFTTPGQFSVGGDGAATYNIPIQVPPGTAGMTPKLSLTYSSSGSNGILGIGWGIDGLSQISRCPTTLVQDGKITGVNYTSTDRFCIDGQRLIATTDSYVNNPNDATKKIYTSTAAYGANLTEYKTELANFAKIISYGAIAYPSGGTGPAYFKVWTKGGQVIEYGNTADSRIEAAGIATARTWGVNKISDTKGNTITITYIEDNPNGEAYVSRIDYTGNANSTPVLAPYASVQFIYEARPDTSTGYQGGSIIKSTKRMTNVRTYNGSTLIKDYRLTYELSTATQRSRLKTLTECDGATTPICKQATVMGWGDLQALYTKTLTPVSGSDWNANYVWTGDYNGDGRTDLLSYYAGNFITFFPSGLIGDLLVSLTPGTGLVTTISYKPITDNSVYTKDIGTNTAAYPVQDIQAPAYVVSSYTQSDGTGGAVTTNYNYGGLKAELTGRGSLGFRYVKESSPDSNISLTTFYKQDYPYIGLPLQTEKRILSSNLLIGASQLTYANTDLTTGTMISKFPYLSQSVEQAFELDGTLINTTTTTNQYDAYGNVTQVSVDSGDGYIKTTANVYNNDTTNWFLGRLLRSTVTSTSP